ncbi:MAG: hypothetical protein ABSF91_10005 [Bacteroidota bacterium]|jgi:hypothetical protein
MNYNDFMLPALIIVYAAFEYHRRERAHKERMDLLKRDIKPPERAQGSVLAGIMTYSIPTMLLLGMIYLFTVIGVKRGIPSYPFFIWPAALIVLLILTVLLILVMLIVRRDIKTYRTTHKL